MTPPPLALVTFPVRGMPFVETIPNTLEALQSVVGGGYIEQVAVYIERLDRNLALLCDEDGESKHLPRNRRVGGYVIRGRFAITKVRGDDFATLTEAEQDAVMASIDGHCY